MTIKETEGSLRIEGIEDIYQVQDNLKTRGTFDNSKTLFAVRSPFEVTFKTTWWPTAVDVSIKKKPFFIPAKVIFEHLRKEVEKATLSS